MFSDVVSKTNRDTCSRVIYLSKEDYYDGDFCPSNISNKPYRFAYVGSINNIIDIDLIVDIIKRAGEKHSVQLVVIGGGESADRLFRLCNKYGVDFEDHGIIYDDTEKHKILSTCHFGLNIMKDSVAIGATMKSLEYFHEGLILVNNIPADTATIVDKYDCGINIDRENLNAFADFLNGMDSKTLLELKKHSRRAYEELFDAVSISKQFGELFSTIGV